MRLSRTTLFTIVAAGATLSCSDARVDRLERRIAELEAQQQAHEQLVSDALDQTATQLEQFLVRMARLQGIELPPDEPEETSERTLSAGAERATRTPSESSARRADTGALGPWWWLMPLLVSALVGGLYWWRSYRRDRDDWPERTPLIEDEPAPSRRAGPRTPEAVEFAPAVVVEPPETNGVTNPAPFLLEDPPLEFFDPPAAVRQEFVHSDPAGIISVVSRWLGEDPRILLEPGPSLEADGGLVRVHYHLAPGITVEETEEIEREVARLAARPDRVGEGSGSSAG